MRREQMEMELEDQLKEQGFEGPSQMSRIDLSGKLTDYISHLQKAVNDALNGDPAAFQKLEELFGFSVDVNSDSHSGND